MRVRNNLVKNSGVPPDPPQHYGELRNDDARFKQNRHP